MDWAQCLLPDDDQTYCDSKSDVTPIKRLSIAEPPAPIYTRVHHIHVGNNFFSVIALKGTQASW